MTESCYEGRCFCEAVRIEVRGEPFLAGFCHCQDCRDWSNAPVTSFAMWTPDAVTIAQGKKDIARFSRTPETPRAWCARCGSHIGAFRDKYDPPHMAISPHMLPTFLFAPTLHVFCDEAVIDVRDNLPRYRDLPPGFAKPRTKIAGSGELMPGSPSP